MNYDLKIHTHVRLGNDQELPPAFPESTEELHIDVEDTPESDLGPHFAKIMDFIGENDTFILGKVFEGKIFGAPFSIHIRAVSKVPAVL